MSLPASKSKTTSTEASFQHDVVQLISVAKRPEEALDLLCEHYHVERPRLRMGLPSGEKRALGCYVHHEKTIYISSQEYLYDPYVLIHEFYHHLRHVGGKHRGTERHARDFALEFLKTARLAPVPDGAATPS